MSHRDDDVFARIASLYVQADGERLKTQWADIKAKGETPTPSSGFEERVMAQIRGDMLDTQRQRSYRWKRYAGVAGGLAAALVLVFVSLRLTGYWPSRHLAPAMPPSAAESSAELAEISQKTYDAEAIPLHFAMPPSFTVASVETDNGKTIYHLADAAHDDVVLTLEPLTAETALSAEITQGLQAIHINGQTAYGRAQADYSMVTFAKDGLVYNLTCQYDSHTIITLSESIL